MYCTSILLTYSCAFHARSGFLAHASCLAVLMHTLIYLRALKAQEYVKRIDVQYIDGYIEKLVKPVNREDSLLL